MQIRAGEVAVEAENVLHKVVDLVILEFKLLEEMPGNAQEVESVDDLFARRCAHRSAPFAALADGIADRRQGGLLNQFGGGVADLFELPVRQLEEGGEDVDAAFEFVGDRLFVFDLVIEDAPGILDQRANLHLEGTINKRLILRLRRQFIRQGEIHVQPFVAEGVLGTLDRGNLVGHFDDLECWRQQLRDRSDPVFIETDDADADQVGEVVFDLVRLFLRLQPAPIFALELLDAFLFVLDPGLDLGHGIAVPLLESGADQVDISVLGRFEVLAVAVVIFAEGAFFLVKVEGGHGVFLVGGGKVAALRRILHHDGNASISAGCGSVKRDF